MDMTSRELMRRGVLGFAVAVFVATGAWAALDGEFWILLAWVGYPVMGALILVSRPGNAVGRIMLAIGLLWGVAGLGSVDGLTAAISAEGELALTLAAYLAWPLIALLVVVFPTGRPETLAGRVTARAIAVVMVLIVVVGALDPSPLEASGRPNPFGWDASSEVAAFVVDGGGFLVVPLLLLAAMIDLLARRRRSVGAQRLQYRWFFFGATAMFVVIVATYFIPGDGILGTAVLASVFNALPVSIGIAVTRFGLFEIDRVVSRSIAYLCVTAAVLATYVLVVTALLWVVPELDSLVVAVATLAAAAVFRPARRAVQGRVDRRFNRSRYDAQQTLDQFGDQMRDVVDPSAATAGLVAAVGATMEPARIDVWVRGRS